MKIREGQKSIGRMLATGVAMVSFGAQAITTNVSTVAELVGALRAWNNSTYSKSSNTMILKAGSYDLTDYAEDFYFVGYKVMTNINNRIGISSFTLRGETDNPRDTVLYCRDGDTNGRSLLYNYAGRVRDLTVSNVVSKTRGAGIYNHNMNSFCSNVVVTCCTAAENGGGMSSGVLTDCVLIGNVSQKAGGGTVGSGLVHCEVRDNVAKGSNGGGGLFQGFALDSVFVGNSASSASGGGVSGSKGLTNCLIACNSARKQGGGAYGGDVQNYQMVECVVSNNTICGAFSKGKGDAQPCGAGVSYAKLEGGRVTMNLISIDNPEKDLYACGGGVCSCVAEDVVIDGNAVTGVCNNTQGGGAYNSTLTRCMVMNNISSTLGSGIISGTATDCVISNNASMNGSAAVRGAKLDGCMIYGGSIDPQESVLNTVIRGYTNGNVIARGTSVLARDADLHIEGSTHLVIGWGGFTNCLFVGQDMTTSYSALFGASKNNETILSSCTIADNRVPYTHAGFKDESNAKFTAVNCIFSDNFTDGGVASDLRSSYTNLQFTSCLIKKVLSFRTLEELRYDCPGCITGKSAKFSRIEETPYIVRSSSPAVGNGLYEDWMASATDIRRDPEFPRSVDGKVDMGCYQGCVPGPGLLLFLR